MFSLLTLEGIASPLRAVTIVGSALVSYLSANIIYRLLFHPLAKFPGPFWCRVSAFPAYYHTLKQDRHVWLWCLEQHILFNTPTGYKQIFNAKANVKKAEYYKAYPRNVDAVTTWNTTDKEVHARKRRVLNNAFSDKAIRSAEPFVHANVDRWCELLGQEIDDGDEGWSRSLNMADWANNLIFDILGDLCFGKSFGMKEPGSELTYVPDLMVSFLAILHPMALSPFTTLWVWLKPRGLNSLLAATAPPALANWQGFVEKCFTARAEAEEELRQDPKPEAEIRKDFFHYLYKAIDPETGNLGYSKDELFGESESLIIAGSDTTAISTAAAMFYLARNPRVQLRLAAEITEAFENVDSIKGGTTLQSNCVYLQAFIKEVLRMSPPVPAELSREVEEGGIVVDGHYLPSGMKVSTCCYCLHHNESIYDRPFEFRPERWIAGEDGSTPESVALADSGYCPFSGGPRGCVGKNLAYLEMSIVIAKIVYQFEVKQDSASNLGGGSPEAREGRRVPGQYQLYDIFVGIREGPMVQLRRR